MLRLIARPLCRFISTLQNFNGKRLGSLFLMVVMLQTGVPPVVAAPVARDVITSYRSGADSLARNTVAVATNVGTWLAPRSASVQKLASWFSSNVATKGLERGMPRVPTATSGPPARRQLRIEEREARVEQLEINPRSDVILESGQRSILSVVPLDHDGNAVHGLKAEWKSSNSEVLSVSADGEVLAYRIGEAVITAMIAGKRGSFRVQVIPPTRPRFLVSQVSSPGGLVESAQIGKSKAAHQNPRNVTAKAHAARVSAIPVPAGGDDRAAYYYPNNGVGVPPGTATPGAGVPGAATGSAEMPGSANFSFGLPIAGLPGRGIDVSLGLVYNSRVWNKSTNHSHQTVMTYDVGKGWPAPGFMLGYGYLEDQSNEESSQFMLVDPDGTRHQMPLGPIGSTGFETTDGTFIHAEYGSLTGLLVTYPNGTRVLFSNYVEGGRSYPVKITDRHGNYILISYVSGGKISTIQDTLGRYIRFFYDSSNGDLIAITAPGFTADRQVMRFYYQDINITAGQSGLFQSGIVVTAPATAHVLKYIYYANSVETNDAHIGFRYDYSGYGMVYQMTKFHGMTVSGSALDAAGSVSSEGTQAALTTYNYPTSPSALSDAPAYTSRTDDWAGRLSAQPVYYFSSNQTTGVSTVTAPDGTVSETHAKVHQDFWDDGLITESIAKVGSTVLADVVFTWEQGPNNANPRLQKVQSTNDAQQTTAITYEYDPNTSSNFNNVLAMREYSFSSPGTLGTELRRTETTYVTDSAYIDRRLLHLPTTVRIYGRVNGSMTQMAQTGYSYDETTPASYSDISTMMFSDPGTNVRGNLTRTKNYPDVANLNSHIDHTNTYDVAGNVLTAQVNCCQQKSFAYSSAFHYAYMTSVTRGSGPTLTSSASYDYDTGLPISSTDENGQQGTSQYATDSLRPIYVQRADGSTVHFYYSEGLQGNSLTGGLHYFTHTESQLDATRSAESYTFYDGRGAVTQTFDNWTAVNGWSTQDIEYNVMGQAYRSSNPYYSGGYGWLAINPTSLWTTSTFDNLGSVTQVTMPSGDDPNNPTSAIGRNAYYGNRLLDKDAAGKEHISQSNELGQVTDVWEVAPPDGATESVSFPGFAEATAGYHTTYQYDALNNLVQVTQAVPGGVTQNRFFKYDSMGRLTHERRVEQGAPYSASDPVTQNASWSRVYTYNSQGKLSDAGDAGSVHTTFTYDGLNRVSTIAYSDGTTPAAVYTYDQTRGSYLNAGRLTTMSTAAVGSTPSTATEYDYDLMGRTVAHRQKIGTTTYAMSYTYNFANELLSETYPSGRVLNYAYDEAGRLASLADNNGVTYANTFTYAPQGGLSSETLGNTAVHSMTYNNAVQPNKVALSLGGSEQQRYNYAYGQVNPSDGAVDTTKNNGQIGRIEGYISNTKQWDQRFSYDPLARLTDAAEYRGDNASQTYKAHYDYDRFGNRFQYQNNANLSYVTTQPADVNQATNRFISTGGTPVTYDNGATNGPGNITSDGKFRGLSYGHDANNRQTTANGTGVSQTSVYDCAGQRVVTTGGGVTRTMVYDIFGQDIVEYNGGALERENIYRGGQLLATREFPVRTNVALAANGGVASASSILSGSFPASGSNNGDRKGANWGSGGGWVDSSSGSFPDWLEIDFDGSKTIDEIDVFTVQDNYSSPSEPTEAMTFNTYGLTAYDVEYWNGSDWVTVSGGAVTGNNKIWGKISFSALTTSKIKLRTNAAIDNGYSRITEIEAWSSTNVPQTANVALAANGATASASSILSASFPASGTNNGDRKGASWGSGGGWADSGAGSFPDWLEIDFSGSQTISEVDVFTIQDNYQSPTEPTEAMTFSTYGLTAYTVQYWDGTNWATVPGGNVTGNNRVWKKISFTALTTSKIRVQTDAAIDNGYSRVTEVEAWGTIYSDPGQLSYVLQDLQGSARIAMNNNGSSSAIIARHDYLPFGEEIGSGIGMRTAGQKYGGTDRNRQKYASTERDDATGLDHTLFRKYENTSGRWTTPDPMSGSIGDPQSLNAYSYASNDPVNSVDPTGLMTCMIDGSYADCSSALAMVGAGAGIWGPLHSHLWDANIGQFRTFTAVEMGGGTGTGWLPPNYHYIGAKSWGWTDPTDPTKSYTASFVYAEYMHWYKGEWTFVRNEQYYNAYGKSIGWIDNGGGITTDWTAQLAIGGILNGVRSLISAGVDAVLEGLTAREVIRQAFGRAFPTKVGSLGRQQPFNPANGRYLPMNMNPGLAGSQAAFFAAGFAEGLTVAAMPGPPSFRPAKSGAQFLGQMAGYAVGSLIGPKP